MATQITETRYDDLDGSKLADETVSFDLDGASYEIDLTKKNAAALRKALAPYVTHGRQVARSRFASTRGRSTRSSRKRASSQKGASAGNVREWAVANGYEVSSRGRIPAAIQEAYDQAQ